MRSLLYYSTASVICAVCVTDADAEVTVTVYIWAVERATSAPQPVSPVSDAAPSSKSRMLETLIRRLPMRLLLLPKGSNNKQSATTGSPPFNSLFRFSRADCAAGV